MLAIEAMRSQRKEGPASTRSRKHYFLGEFGHPNVLA
jgi:hypothetical protein